MKERVHHFFYLAFDNNNPGCFEEHERQFSVISSSFCQTLSFLRSCCCFFLVVAVILPTLEVHSPTAAKLFTDRAIRT